MSTTKLDTLKINKLTQLQYDSATKDANQLYLVTDNPPQLTTNMEQNVGTSSTKYPSSYAVTNALDNKVTKNADITGATHSKITYDSKGLVTGGSDLALTDLGVTATASELNVLDGITATTTELNYTDGVTSNIQTQLNNKSAVKFIDYTD